MWGKKITEKITETFLRCLGAYGGPLFPGRIVMLAPNLARPRPAAPPGASTQTVRGMSGFWIRQVLGIPLHGSLQARTKKFLCKPAEEQNPRLTRG